MLIWEALHRVHQELVEVLHFKAHRYTKGIRHMAIFEQFTTEGSEKADELAKDGAMMDGGVMAQIRASTFQQRREEVNVEPAFTVWWMRVSISVR